MPTTSTNYGLSKPLVNNPTDQDLWGGYINTDLDSIDAVTLTAMNLTYSAKNASFNVSAPTTGSTTTGDARKIFGCNATSGAITASLPAASTASGMVIAFKKVDSSANAVTLQANGAELIDGANTQTIAAQYDCFVIQCDSGEWNIVAKSTSGFAPIASPAFTGVPTAPTAAVNARTTQLATTAFANPAASIGANGYAELPSGVIIQWGSVSASESLTNQTINFPLTFPSTCYSVTTSLIGSTDPGEDASYIKVKSVSATQVVFQYTSSRYWMAIGS